MLHESPTIVFRVDALDRRQHALAFCRLRFTLPKKALNKLHFPLAQMAFLAWVSKGSRDPIHIPYTRDSTAVPFSSLFYIHFTRVRIEYLCDFFLTIDPHTRVRILKSSIFTYAHV